MGPTLLGDVPWLGATTTGDGTVFLRGEYVLCPRELGALVYRIPLLGVTPRVGIVVASWSWMPLPNGGAREPEPVSAPVPPWVVPVGAYFPLVMGVGNPFHGSVVP